MRGAQVSTVEKALPIDSCINVRSSRPRTQRWLNGPAPIRRPGPARRVIQITNCSYHFPRSWFLVFFSCASLWNALASVVVMRLARPRGCSFPRDSFGSVRQIPLPELLLTNLFPVRELCPENSWHSNRRSLLRTKKEKSCVKHPRNPTEFDSLLRNGIVSCTGV